MLSLGQVFLSNYPNPDNAHVYVVIHDKNRQNVLVNFTTKKEKSDTSCVVGPDDHPCLNHESVVNYRDAELIGRPIANHIGMSQISKRYEDD